MRLAAWLVLAFAVGAYCEPANDGGAPVKVSAPSSPVYFQALSTFGALVRRRRVVRSQVAYRW